MKHESYFEVLVKVEKRKNLKKIQLKKPKLSKWKWKLQIFNYTNYPQITFKPLFSRILEKLLFFNWQHHELSYKTWWNDGNFQVFQVSSFRKGESSCYVTLQEKRGEGKSESHKIPGFVLLFAVT